MVLELMISGLCAFVRESCKITDAKALHVLTINHETHEPRLVVVADFIEVLKEGEDSTLYSPDEVIDLADGTQLFVWNLRGYRLDFAAPLDHLSIGIREGTRTAGVKKPDDSASATKDKPEDFSWVPQLALASGVQSDKAFAEPSALNQDKPPGYVSARLMTLKVNPTETNSDNWLEAVIDPGSESRLFNFDNGYEQVIADRVRLTIKAPDAVSLNLYSYSRKRVTKTIRLRRLPLEPLVKVSISNLPSTVEAYKRGDPLHHFMALYDVLSETPMQTRTFALPHEPKAGVSTEPVKCTFCSVCGGP